MNLYKHTSYGLLLLSAIMNLVVPVHANDISTEFYDATNKIGEGAYWMQVYVIHKDDSRYVLSMSAFQYADSLVKHLSNCCKLEIGAKTLKTLVEMTQVASQLEKDDLDKSLEGPPLYPIEFGGQTHSVSNGQGAVFIAMAGICEMAKRLSFSGIARSFKASWKLGTGGVSMVAEEDSKWLQLFKEENLIGRCKPVVITIENKSGLTLRLDPGTDVFTILDSEGKQYKQIDPSLSLLSDLSSVGDAKFQALYTSEVEVFDSGSVSIAVLFAPELETSANWRKIVFSAKSKSSSSLSSKELIPAK